MSGEAQLIAALQEHFKQNKLPKAEHMAVAVALARGDPAVATGTACKEAGIGKGRFWTQIGTWRSKIVDENLLEKYAEGCPEVDEDEAAERDRRAKRAKLERDRYAVAKDIRDTLCGIIERIERRAELEQRAQDCGLQVGWRCPAGCESGCAREQFRLQCAPTPLAMQEKWRQIWEEQHPEPVIPMHRTEAAWENYEERHEAWESSRPSFEITELWADEVRSDFLRCASFSQHMSRTRARAVLLARKLTPMQARVHARGLTCGLTVVLLCTARGTARCLRRRGWSATSVTARRRCRRRLEARSF